MEGIRKGTNWRKDQQKRLLAAVGMEVCRTTIIHSPSIVTIKQPSHYLLIKYTTFHRGGYI